MYGHFTNIKFKIDHEYDIPWGFNGGFLYEKAKFVGTLEQDKGERFLVFYSSEHKEYLICNTNCKVLGHKLNIYIIPQSRGKTMEIAVKKLLPYYKWETFHSETNIENYPNLNA